MPLEGSIPTDDLPEVLYNFYSEVRKKNTDEITMMAVTKHKHYSV